VNVDTTAHEHSDPVPTDRFLPTPIAWGLLLILLVSAVAVWSEHRYEIDDASTSYRYAANLASGEGLVFNPGQRVEGYSNFLWVLALAAGDAIGLAPPYLGPMLGIIAYLAMIVLAWVAIWTPFFDLQLGGVVAVVFIGLSFRSPFLETTHYMQSLDEMNSYAEAGRQVGKALVHLPPQTTVATTLIGTIGYESGLPIID